MRPESEIRQQGEHLLTVFCERVTHLTDNPDNEDLQDTVSSEAYAEGFRKGRLAGEIIGLLWTLKDANELLY
jgi:hypothetical protein